MTKGSDRIAEALLDCIVDAPEAAQKELFAALKDYREKYYRTYEGVRRQPFARKLLEAMEEADDIVREMELDKTGYPVNS